MALELFDSGGLFMGCIESGRVVRPFPMLRVDHLFLALFMQRLRGKRVKKVCRLNPEFGLRQLFPTIRPGPWIGLDD